MVVARGSLRSNVCLCECVIVFFFCFFFPKYFVCLFVVTSTFLSHSVSFAHLVKNVFSSFLPLRMPHPPINNPCLCLPLSLCVSSDAAVGIDPPLCVGDQAKAGRCRSDGPQRSRRRIRFFSWAFASTGTVNYWFVLSFFF